MVGFHINFYTKFIRRKVEVGNEKCNIFLSI